MEEEEKTGKSGNIGLPFGLCSKYGIFLPKNSTPRVAWDALKKWSGKSPTQIYEVLADGKELKKKADKSEWFRKKGEFEKKRFFGDSWHKTSNEYFDFKHVIDNDNILLNTKDVKKLNNGSHVLIVAPNKAVYLKDWQFDVVYGRAPDFSGSFDVVKLNRNYFKPYTFKSGFEGYEGSEEFDFDGLKKIAEEQDKSHMEYTQKNLFKKLLSEAAQYEDSL